MTQDQLRAEILRFTNFETVELCDELLQIFSEYIFLAIREQESYPREKLEIRDALLINQMLLTKVLHLRGVIKGIDYTAKDGTVLHKIIDPTIVASLIRNVYETVSMFNLIYIYPKTNDEKRILYNLWVISGLKYRQKFETDLQEQENIEKLAKEKDLISTLVNEIENTDLYKSLSLNNKAKIQKKLKEKDYKIKFEGMEVVFLNWQQLIETMGIKQEIMGNIYTYFSLYSHPSNVAVFQFNNMFKAENPAYLGITIFNLQNLCMLVSVFVADYIKLFPDLISVFNNLNIRDQVVLNYFNTAARNYSYSINNCLEKLDEI